MNLDSPINIKYNNCAEDKTQFIFKLVAWEQYQMHIKLLKRPSVLVRPCNILLLEINCQEFKTGAPKAC